MKALEEEVRAIHKDGLLWGACELGLLESCCAWLHLSTVAKHELLLGFSACVMFALVCWADVSA